MWDVWTMLGVWRPDDGTQFPDFGNWSITMSVNVSVLRSESEPAT